MWERAFKFAAVGALGIALQLAVLQLLAVVSVPYLLATALAVSAAVIHNFMWHRRWTWRDRLDHHPLAAFTRFALANGAVSLAGNVVAMALLVGLLDLPLVIANSIAIGACGIGN